MSSPVLDISALVKDYRGLRPLRMERLTLHAGDQVAVLGFDEPAAEMMTTLVTGASVPDAGSIHVLGTSTAGIENSDDWLRLVDRVGIVTERAVLLESLTVIQNLAMPFTLEIEPPPDDVRERAAALAAESKLPRECWDQPVGTLAGELRTRLRFARAVSLDPALVLMEHPTALVARGAVGTLAADVQDHRRSPQTCHPDAYRRCGICGACGRNGVDLGSGARNASSSPPGMVAVARLTRSMASRLRNVFLYTGVFDSNASSMSFPTRPTFHGPIPAKL